MKNYLLLPGLLLLCGLLAGCQSPSKSASATTSLEGTIWTLVALDGKPVATTEGLRPQTLFLDGLSKRLNGLSGINRYSGGYELGAKTIKFGMLISTRMAGPTQAMEMETAFLKALNDTTGWAVDGTHLTLRSKDKVVAEFVAQPR